MRCSFDSVIAPTTIDSPGKPRRAAHTRIATMNVTPATHPNLASALASASASAPAPASISSSSIPSSPLSDLAHTPSVAATSPPLSVLSRSPSLPPRTLTNMDASSRYPSPSASSVPQSGSASPLKPQDNAEVREIQVQTDGGPPPKRRKIAERKPRTTEHLDLDNRDAASEAQLDRLLNVLRRKKKIVVVAGAGISVSAGIPDFRSSQGLFKTLKDKHKIKGGGQALFDASVYRDDKSTAEFHKMVRDLSHLTKEAKPTAFHHMLATLAQEGRLMRLYSQNVDGLDTSLKPLATNIPLNTKAPWPVTIQVHGGLEKMQCTLCNHVGDFDGSLFQGPEPPLCTVCEEEDMVRTKFGGKRSRGIGRLRPRMVLYNEYNPDEDAIGKVSQADLRRVPDAVIVVGTSLKIPGVRRIVKELCQATRAKRDGFTAWINLDPMPQGPDLKDVWDLVVRGKCDDIATLLHMPHWDCQDLGSNKEEYMVSGSQEREEKYEHRRGRDKIDVVLKNKKRSIEQISDSESKLSVVIPGIKSKLADKVQESLPTPSASPRQGSPLPRKPLPKGRGKQSTLGFASEVEAVDGAKGAKKAIKSTKPRHLKKDSKPKNEITKTFKATKSTTNANKTKESFQSSKNESKLLDMPSPDSWTELPTTLPSLRPREQQVNALPFQQGDATSSEASFHTGQSDIEFGEPDTVPSGTKPREMSELAD